MTITEDDRARIANPSATDPSPALLDLLPTALDLRPCPTWHDAPVLENELLGDRYWRLVVDAPSVARTAEPGQFLMLTPVRDGDSWPVLPRPMAVFDTDPTARTVTVLYGAVGRGTNYLTTFRPGESLLIVGPLGRTFDVDPAADRVLLLGRGIGICSVSLLGARCAQRGTTVTAVSSGRTTASIIGTDFYESHGVRVQEVYDEDGSSDVNLLGGKLRREFAAAPPSLIAVCGSQRLIGLAVALGRDWSSDVQVSIEAHMACGLGYCHGCATGARTAHAESPLVCRDGPVFRCRTS